MSILNAIIEEKFGTNQESYEIKKATLKIDLQNGDWLEVTNVEGDQPVFIIAVDAEGQSALQDLGLNDKDNFSVEEITNRSDISSDFKKSLQGINGSCSVATLFPDACKAGSMVVLTCQKSVQCYLIAMGKEMTIGDLKPATKVMTKIRRVLDSKETPPSLPPPLGKVVKEIRVKKQSAVSYKVKAGQYIQIIDVEGHQCSDFQAFADSDLAKGEEIGIDPTVTRTFMASSYPMPGIYDKYYNLNSVPLIEVVHDTVNRHDTFGLACNAKYYEDRGYPGHINCTDNFNNVLAEYGFKPRLNWVSLNLFFNTFVEDCHAISADVSWSRPGDYVLFKALTDMLCVSSACPDDTSPSNDWNPTDIHLRIYDKDSDFKPAQAFRSTPQSIPTMTKNTAFHQNTEKLTRNFTEYNGYWLANDYTQYGAKKEYWACREGVAIMDLSPLRKYEIYGQDAEKLMQYAVPRDIRRLAVGQIVYSSICYDNGGMIDDGTLYRLCENNFRWVCGSELSGEWLRKVAEDKKWEVWVKESTDEMHNVAVQGPKSRATLKKIIWTPKTQPALEELNWFRFTVGRLNGELGTPVVISRTGYTGELGYEVFCHPKDGNTVWQAIWQAGEEYGITPLGLEALDTIRIEAGLIFAGYEFCDQTDPFEAGIGFSVAKNKTEDYIGKKAIEQRRDHSKETLIGLELSGSETANHGDGVFIDRQQVGVITSATRSPILKKNIALCRVSTGHSQLGTKLEVEKLDGQKRIVAKVVAFPFYDPQKERVRAS